MHTLAPEADGGLRASPPRRISKAILLSLLAVVLCAGTSMADDEAREETVGKTPKIVFSSPQGVRPGTQKYTLRGTKLDDVTAADVRFAADGKPADAPPIAVKIIAKSKSAGAVGDSQIELEFAVASDARQSIVIRLKNAAGDGNAFVLPGVVDGQGRRMTASTEREPNEGFRNATPIALCEFADGAIERAQDVDVFRFSAKRGDRLAISVFAARGGSPLDATLSIFDAQGRTLAIVDDMPKAKGDATLDSHDPQVEFVAPSTGDFFLSVQDADDAGSTLHAYRLSLSAK
jgi:hypothetical protein